MNQIQIKGGNPGSLKFTLNEWYWRWKFNENLRRLINSLVIELYKYQAESERKKIKERQAQGIEIAKKKGKFKGRQLKF